MLRTNLLIPDINRITMEQTLIQSHAEDPKCLKKHVYSDSDKKRCFFLFFHCPSILFS